MRRPSRRSWIAIPSPPSPWPARSWCATSSRFLASAKPSADAAEAARAASTAAARTLAHVLLTIAASSCALPLLHGRGVARVLRAGQELLGVVLPELAHVAEGLERGVRELAALALHLAHVDVEDGLAVIVEVDG